MAEEKTFTKAELDAAIADAKEAQDTKNAELLNEVKKLKAEVRKVKEINPDDVAAIEAERDKALTDLAAAQKTAKEATTAAEKATKALEAEAGANHKLLVDNGLRELLATNGVTNATHQTLALARLKELGPQVVQDGDNRVVKFGDQLAPDFVKGWTAGEEGKHVVSAPMNGGGGAPGGKGGETGKLITDTAFAALNPKQRAAHFAEGGLPPTAA